MCLLVKWVNGINGVKNLKDIVEPKSGYKKQVAEIIDGFKLVIKREIPRRQEENLKKLASLFLNPVKVAEPIVVNLEVGQGKSTLLVQFVKYMYKVNKEFSSVIVKRTLKEGREFCMDVGVNTECPIENFNIGYEETTYKEKVREIYYGDLQRQEKSHEDYFVSKLIRGFNYADCLKWKDPNDKKSHFGKLSSEYVDYSPILCRDCEEICGAKLSKWSIEKHPSLVITHQRLFMSNDVEETMENISARGILIIDEKVETKDILY